MEVAKKNVLRALFFLKVPLKACPPQLFEASYAPALIGDRLSFQALS
jgi:hypothetical protein